jgi:putative membrane protein
MRWWQKVILNTLIFLVLANFLNGVHVDTWVTALIAAVVLSLLNLLIKPIIVVLSIPISCLTLGLFYFVINGAMIWLTSYLVAGFTVSSFIQAIFVSLVLSLVNSLVEAN